MIRQGSSLLPPLARMGGSLAGMTAVNRSASLVKTDAPNLFGIKSFKSQAFSTGTDKGPVTGTGKDTKAATPDDDDDGIPYAGPTTRTYADGSTSTFSTLADIRPGPVRDVSHLKSVEKEITLKDGTKAQISLLTRKDYKDLKAFYEGLSHDSISAIKRSTCVYIRQDDDAITDLLALNMNSLRSDSESTLVVRVAGKEGSRIVACSGLSVDRSDGTCTPAGTIVADSFQKKGIGVAIKLAQVECGRLDGARQMTGRGVSEEVVRTYEEAAKQAGLKLEIRNTPMFTWHITSVKMDLGTAPGGKDDKSGGTAS